jgi:hypothetical protein
MNRRAGLAVAAATLPVIALAGCGSPGSAYYLASDSSQVLLVEWNTPANGQASGDITYDSISTAGSDTSAPDSLSVQSDPVTVTINGSQVTMSGFLGESITGTLSSEQLTITTPPDTSTGEITTDTLSASDASAYNDAVASLNKTINQSNATAAANVQAQQQQQADAQAQQQAQSDLGTLQQNDSFTSDLSTLASDMQQAQSDLGQVESDVSAGQGQYCDGVSTAEDDASAVDDDGSGFSDDLGSLANDIATARQDISTLQGDLRALKADGLSYPSGAKATISAARQAITAAISTANQEVATVNGYMTSATNDANSLVSGACSSSGSASAPTPISTIS